MRSPRLILLAGLATTLPAAAADLDGCLECHRPGQIRGEVPLIEGQHRAYLVHQLQRFRDRHRLAFPMSGVAAGMDEQVIRELASALAERPWRKDAIPMAPDAVQRGRKRAAQLACDSCHGERFLGTGDVPRTAGQQPGYLARQIMAFGRGHRYHPPTGIGSRMQTLEGEEARDIAAYLHSIGSPPVPDEGAAKHEDSDQR